MRGTRLAWVVGGLLALYVLSPLLGLNTLVAPESLRHIVDDAGPWGRVAFAAIFAAGVLVQIPGLLFVSAAPFLFPAPEAWWLSLLAGNLAVNLNFAVVRRIGGANKLELTQPWAQRLFDQLERRPLRAVALLRLVFSMFPPLTGALALTPVSARDHALATALGLFVPITGVIWFEALLMR